MERVEALWRRHQAAVTIAVTGALALACYGFVLRLPFFRDDLPIMTWLSGRGWAEIWIRSSENPFYRPLAFTIYKLGRLLPTGADRVALHGVNLLIHWISGILVMLVVKLRHRSGGEALLASVLFVVFPFSFMAIPWVTALSHPLVTMLTLTAVLAALKAEEGPPHWWGLSLLATALAPMAHESGHVCAFIVAGIVVIERQLERELEDARRLLPAALGILLSLGALIWRNSVPGVGEAAFAGLQDWLGNTMFALHGLVYPVAPFIGSLVHRFGAQDFLLVGLASVGLSAVLGAVALRRRDWRWAVSGIWWWAWGILPAAASLSYGYNYTSPRVYALAAPGIVMLWAGLIVSLGRLVARPGMQLGIAVLLGGAIIGQNTAFLLRQQELSTMLNRVYDPVLEVADPEGEPQPGFVNLPTSLAHGEKTYAMILENVLFIPSYTTFSEFLAVNGVGQAEAVVYPPVAEESRYVCGLLGEGVDWDGIRQFAAGHETVWVARWRGDGLGLDYVGGVETGVGAPAEDSLVRFESGPTIESASVEPMGDRHWALILDWAASGPVDAQIFVHVRDAQGNLVTQVDGPALGGMIPPWSWREGDRVHDVRHIETRGSEDGVLPYTVQVGLFNAEGRYRATMHGTRCPEDACAVATLVPEG